MNRANTIEELTELISEIGDNIAALALHRFYNTDDARSVIRWKLDEDETEIYNAIESKYLPLFDSDEVAKWTFLEMAKTALDKAKPLEQQTTLLTWYKGLRMMVICMNRENEEIHAIHINHDLNRIRKKVGSAEFGWFLHLDDWRTAKTTLERFARIGKGDAAKKIRVIHEVYRRLNTCIYILFLDYELPYFEIAKDMEFSPFWELYDKETFRLSKTKTIVQKTCTIDIIETVDYNIFRYTDLKTIEYRGDGKKGDLSHFKKVCEVYDAPKLVDIEKALNNYQMQAIEKARANGIVVFRDGCYHWNLEPYKSSFAYFVYRLKYSKDGKALSCAVTTNEIARLFNENEKETTKAVSKYQQLERSDARAWTLEIDRCFL